MKHTSTPKPSKKGLHTFSRNVLKGCTQLTVIWYGLGALLHLLAPYTPDYFRTLLYRDSVFETAPVLFGVGDTLALISDIVLRRTAHKD